MKFTVILFSMLALTLSPTTEANPIVECGNLGVMTILTADLPEGVSLSDVRKCKGHPLGRNRPIEGASLASLDAVDTSSMIYKAATSAVDAHSELNTLEERSCYKDAPYGCSRGYCWKVCGNKDKGEWCWNGQE